MLKLSPKNIIIAKDGQVKVTNLTSCLHMEEFEHSIFNLNFVTNYTAPELLYRQYPGPWTDFYCVGLILYEIMIKHVKGLISVLSRSVRTG